MENIQHDHARAGENMHALESKILEAKKSGRTALIPFVTAGFPDKARFWDILEELDESGADIIEIGVPFSDPVADGPVVQESSERALRQGVNLRDIIAELARRRKNIKAGIVLMGYLNPFLQYGYEKLAQDASLAGVDGFIVPDLPFEESGPLKSALRDKKMALIPLVGPNTSRERMALYARDAQGYVYVVSVLGTTGERKNVAPDVARIIDAARDVFSVPIALGFGLKRPGQLEVLPAQSRPDAAVFGSALLKHLDAGKSPEEFLACWRAAS